MNDRKTILALLVVALLLEGLLLVRGGLLAWLTSGPHSAAELRGLFADWRTATSVGLVAVILWLVTRWFRLAPADNNPPTRH